MTGTKIDGEKTVVFRKEGGAWKVMHVHSSVPFYMVKAAVDLKPATAA